MKKVVKIRRIDEKKGDTTTTMSLQEAISEVEKAIEDGHLVVDETTRNEEKAIRNALGLTEQSSLRIYRPVAGG